jgi:hypothetical protein
MKRRGEAAESPMNGMAVSTLTEYLSGWDRLPEKVSTNSEGKRLRHAGSAEPKTFLP